MQLNINEFWLKKRFVLFGLSRKEKSISREVYELLTGKGYEVYPINPNSDEIHGIRCYRRLEDVPHPAEGAIIITNPAISHQVVRACEQAGIRDLWFQYNTMDDALKTYCDEKGLRWTNTCALLYHKEVGFPHSLHRFFHRLFGRHQG